MLLTTIEAAKQQAFLAKLQHSNPSIPGAKAATQQALPRSPEAAAAVDLGTRVEASEEQLASVLHLLAIQAPFEEAHA